MSPDSKDKNSQPTNILRNRKLNDQQHHRSTSDNIRLSKLNATTCSEAAEDQFENAKLTNLTNRRLDRSATDENDPFSFQIKINLPVFILAIVAFLMRFWYLEYPKSIVFDELHYGRFVSLYMKKTFYFDSQPPLGKQLIAILAWLFDYNGDTQFTGIGKDYADTVPIKALRFLPCLCGSLLVPLTYYIALELKLNRKFAFLASLFVLLENSFLTQSKFILMDMILIFFATFGVYLFILFRKSSIFSFRWFTYLIASCCFLSFAICVKFVGIIWLALCLTVCLYDYWWLLPNKTISSSKLLMQSFIYFLTFIVLPFIIYLIVFYVHLTILTKAGPHDTIMTSAFQASLDGGLSSIIRGQPLEIAHGSQITLKHTHGRACWLHSHEHNYPITYPDGRGSSHQQQVTCYSFKDMNNWWIVKRPSKDDLIASDPIDVIKNGDIIQLVHGMTSRLLNSHDVAAPMSPFNQEVSGYINYNISMPAQNLWKVDLLNSEDTLGIWHTISSNVRLIHVNTSQALKFSGKQYPDWGFNQHEVVTDYNINNADTIWNVEEHRYTKLKDAKERERDLVHAEFVPLSPTRFTFWEKLKELQYKMLIHDQENIQEHVYSSSPLDLILLNKGIAYWISNNSNSQIHLLGNLFLHYFGLLSVLVYLGLLCFYLLRRRRKFYDLNDVEWEKFKNIGLICSYGYILHLLPLFFTNKLLFFHHYMPSVLFKIILLTTILDHLKLYSRRSSYLLSYFILSLVAYNFIKFLPFSYGKWLNESISVERLKWKPSWNFIVQS